MWRKKSKGLIAFLTRVIVALIAITALYMVLFTIIINSTLRHVDLHVFGEWEPVFYLLLLTIIPFLICVAFGIGLVLRFLGEDFKMAVFASGCAGLLHFWIATSEFTSIFNKAGIIYLLHIPVTVFVGVSTYYIVSKLTSNAMENK